MLRSVRVPPTGRVPAILGVASFALIGLAAWNINAAQEPADEHDVAIVRNAQRMIEEGRETFRFDTFGSEAFFGETLQWHQAIQGERFGGVGSGVNPKTALAVGLKVDAAPFHRPLPGPLGGARFTSTTRRPPLLCSRGRLHTIVAA